MSNNPEKLVPADYDLPPLREVVDEEVRIAGKEVAQFKGYVKSWGSDRFGELTVTVAVPSSEKYNAMPVTDVQDLMFTIAFVKPQRPLGDDD